MRIPKEAWDERFNTEEYLYGITPNDFLVSNLHTISGPSVLCLADGEGRNSVYLAQQGYVVTAVDFSQHALKKASQLADEAGVSIKFINANLEQFKMGEYKWNAVISIFCHLDSDTRRFVHRNVMNGLKKNGIFLLEAYSKKQLYLDTGGPRHPDLLYSKKELHGDFTDFTAIDCNELCREIHEGSLHNGMSEVVQFRGIK